MGSCCSSNKSTKQQRKPVTNLFPVSVVSNVDPPPPAKIRNSTTARTSVKKTRLRLLCDYPGESSGNKKLVSKNEIVELVSDNASGTCVVSLPNGNRITIPTSIVSKNITIPVTNQDWYFENLDREQCVRILTAGKQAGTFMIRPSTTQQNSFVLSILYENGDVRHHLIKVENGCYYLEKNRFSNLEDLVTYHRSNLGNLKHLLTQHPKKQMPSVFVLENDAWELDPFKIAIQNKIGQGEFGDVFRAVYNNSQVVAVKTLRDQSKASNLTSFLTEAHLMKKLKHDRLVNLLGIVTSGPKFMIITEYVHHGSLLRFLRDNLKLQIGVMVEFCVQISEGMMFLERNKVVHCDLAARNVLVDENLFCKISDFGMTKIIEGETSDVEVNAKIPIKWCAPEVLRRLEISTKVDVWSFGVVMFEIFTNGQVPYGDMKNSEVTDRVLRGEILEKPHTCPDFYYEIMCDCWAMDADERPTFEKIHSELKSSDKSGGTYYK